MIFFTFPVDGMRKMRFVTAASVVKSGSDHPPVKVVLLTDASMILPSDCRFEFRSLQMV